MQPTRLLRPWDFPGKNTGVGCHALLHRSQGAAPAWLISGVEMKAESVCICFIDDCMDCDVPLAELTFSRECSPNP